MRVGLGIDQLGVDTDMAARPLDAPFEHVADPQLAADLPRADRLVSVRERGIGRDHEHIRDLRQVGREILSDRVREILLLAVLAEVSEGQHHDRQAWRRASALSRQCADKAIAAPGYSLNAAPLRSPPIEHPAEYRYLDGEVAVFEHGPGPNGGDDLVL